VTEPYPKLAGVVLAAGGSVRLGQPKQLLQWQGRSLLQRSVEHSLAVCAAGVVVVIGAYCQRLMPILDSLSVRMVVNEDWNSGMAGSLQRGITAVNGPEVNGALVTVVDQPLLSAGDLARLAALWQQDTARPVAAAYGGQAGVPAILPSAMFTELAQLEGDTGAQKILAAAEGLRTLPLPAAALDIDTPADIVRLQTRAK